MTASPAPVASRAPYDHAARPGVALLALAVLVLAVAAVACSRPSTADQLRAAIDDYRQDKNGVTAPQVDALFAKLDAEIAAQKADAAAKPANARADDERRIAAAEAERTHLVEQYASAGLERLGRAAGEAARGVGDAIGKGLEDAGRALRDSVREVPPDR
jgi:hypothetical protein